MWKPVKDKDNAIIWEVRYCGIILIRGGQCSQISKILLVRGDVISWAIDK